MGETLWSCPAASTARPPPLGAPDPPPHLPPPPPPHPHPSSGAAAALPGCFIYLFCTNGVAADSFSPGLKRERGKKMLSGSFFYLSLGSSGRSSNSSGGGQGGWTGRRVGRQVGGSGSEHQGRCGPRCGSNGMSPQPWADAEPNLMRPSSFSGKCPRLPSGAATALLHSVLREKARPLLVKAKGFVAPPPSRPPGNH